MPWNSLTMNKGFFFYAAAVITAFSIETVSFGKPWLLHAKLERRSSRPFVILMFPCSMNGSYQYAATSNESPTTDVASIFSAATFSFQRSPLPSKSSTRLLALLVMPHESCVTSPSFCLCLCNSIFWLLKLLGFLAFLTEVFFVITSNFDLVSCLNFLSLFMKAPELEMIFFVDFHDTSWARMTNGMVSLALQGGDCIFESSKILCVLYHSLSVHCWWVFMNTKKIFCLGGQKTRRDFVKNFVLASYRLTESILFASWSS